ncbi:MAG: hypothetical protein UU96_C0016G0013 [Parcubacteria group bacterium GW2011_GWC2_42_13]|nr:MAG: hypothetical protein UU96_C0016G0013 [Parcubacteria group bacterium GW2011_GWC2_42_13]
MMVSRAWEIFLESSFISLSSAGLNLRVRKSKCLSILGPPAGGLIFPLGVVGAMPILILPNSLVLIFLIIDSTPLCPPEFFPKDILNFPKGKSRSSWTIIKSAAFFFETIIFFRARPDLFIKVSGQTRRTLFFLIIPGLIRALSFLSKDQLPEPSGRRCAEFLHILCPDFQDPR